MSRSGLAENRMSCLLCPNSAQGRFSSWLDSVWVAIWNWVRRRLAVTSTAQRSHVPQVLLGKMCGQKPSLQGCTQAPSGLLGVGCKTPPSSGEENSFPMPRADTTLKASEPWEVLVLLCLHEGRITSCSHS